MKKIFYGWLLAALAALCLLPWQQQEAGLFAGEWLRDGQFFAERGAPAVLHLLSFGAWPLGVFFALLAASAALVAANPHRKTLGLGQIALGGAGLLWLAWLGWGPLAAGTGLGFGALLLALCLLFLLTSGAAPCGVCRGDAFVAGAIGLIICLISLFVLFPVALILVSAGQPLDDGGTGAAALARRLADPGIWSLNCVAGPGRCGVAWNTLALALLTGVSATFLGLVFALLVTRTNGRWVRPMRAITILPIVTPPFVLGLALILLFGRNGAITGLVGELFGIEQSRWLYGMTGVWLSQMLAFAPIAFMTLIGVVEGVSPSLEEASGTLGASSWQTFVKVSLPLMRPGIANAFLL
ncbi:MAG: ABC transporter permease subunit, partial [Janthinobacterium sp.]